MTQQLTQIDCLRDAETLTCHHYVADWQAGDEVDYKPAADVILRDQLLVDDEDTATIVIGRSKVEANILCPRAHRKHVFSG